MLQKEQGHIKCILKQILDIMLNSNKMFFKMKMQVTNKWPV